MMATVIPSESVSLGPGFPCVDIVERVLLVRDSHPNIPRPVHFH